MITSGLWNFDERRRIYVVLTPALQTTKVKVEVFLGTATHTLEQGEIYVWSPSMPRSLFDDVLKYFIHHLAVAEVNLMDLLEQMGAGAEQLPGLSDRASET